MEQANSPAPESMGEAAGRAAAALTTRLMDAIRRTPGATMDPVTLQSALALAFEQGANWGCDRAMQIISAPLPPANRRPL